MALRRWSVAVLSTAVLALAGGCGSGKSSSTPTTTSAVLTTLPGTTAPAAVVDIAKGELPATPMTVVLSQTYRTQGAFDATVFAVSSGSVTAAWYRAGDFWLVYYRGLEKAKALGKCPGNSLKTATGFDFVSNSPYGALACKGFATTVLPPGSLRLCGDKAVVYTSKIPVSASGALVASLEQGMTDGSIQGMTGQVAADASKAPTIDVSQCQVVS
jgi:hypothetical protein